MSLWLGLELVNGMVMCRQHQWVAQLMRPCSTANGDKQLHVSLLFLPWHLWPPGISSCPCRRDVANPTPWYPFLLPLLQGNPWPPYPDPTKKKKKKCLLSLE